MNLKTISILFFCLFIYQTGLAQNGFSITGKVLDENSETLIGATIQEVANLANGTTTDVNGTFKMTVPNGRAIVRVSYLGYQPQDIRLNNQHSIVVTLQPDDNSLEEVVVVAHGVQKRVTMTGSASTIRPEEIKRVPSASISNVLAGRLPGFYSQQRSGQPGQDAADFFIRGTNSLNGDNKPLIVVDDIEYSYDQLAQLSANEIESITILKDAATTAVYGLKGANGVLVITTTRGMEGRPSINFTVENGINQIINMPSVLDAYSTASLYNEAQMNDAYGMSESPNLQFTSTDLEFYRNGRDPYGHPNVDWVNALLNRISTTQKYNVDVRGGNSTVKYFATLGYYNQGGNMKEFTPLQKNEDANPNYFYHRYNFRSNLDFTPTKTTSIKLDLNGTFETVNQPAGMLSGTVFGELKNYSLITAYAMPESLPNGKASYATHPGAAAGSPVNPIARYGNSGYIRNFRNSYNASINIQQKLDFITKGLSAGLNVSYGAKTGERRDLTRSASAIPAYSYNPEEDSYIPRAGGSTKFPAYGVGGLDNTYNSTVTYQARANYNRTFYNHHIYLLYLLSRRTYIDQNKLSDNDQSMTWRVGYDWSQRYLLEFNVAYNGNDRFSGKQKFGWFPAISVGWNIGEEAFFKKNIPMIQLFKLRASYGLVGSDKSFEKDVNTTDVIWVGGNNTYGGMMREGSLVNTDATWEKERKFDVGLDVNMLDGMVRFTVDYFYNYRYDQLIPFGDVPAIIGQTLPQRNIGKSSNRGFDGELTFRKKFGEVDFSLGGTFSRSINKIEYISEAPAYPYQAQTGQRIGLSLGYHCVGFYQPEDFNADGTLKTGIPAPVWANNLQPGDLRYADLSGDNAIDEADRTWLSKPNLPTVTYGITTRVGWKSWNFTMMWQGSYDYAIKNMGGGLIPFVNNLQPIHLDRWTPINTDASFPRLGITSWDNNNYNTHLSDFWYIDASYLRMRSAEIAYQVPQAWLNKVVPVVHALRLYATGYNLLNFSNLNKLDIDPEQVDNSVYPTSASFMFGAQIAF